jgi:hypothetical protein
LGTGATGVGEVPVVVVVCAVGEVPVVVVVCAKVLACDNVSATRQDKTHSFTCRISLFFMVFSFRACLRLLHQGMDRRAHYANGVFRALSNYKYTTPLSAPFSLPMKSQLDGRSRLHGKHTNNRRQDLDGLGTRMVPVSLPTVLSMIHHAGLSRSTVTVEMYNLKGKGEGTWRMRASINLGARAD